MSEKGTAKLLNKLLEKSKADDKTIADLRDQLAKADRQREISVKLAIDNTQCDERAKQDHLQKQHDADWAHAAEERAKLLGQLAERDRNIKLLTDERDKLQGKVDGDTSHIAELLIKLRGMEAKLAAAEPQIKLIAEQRKELEQLCDKVRQRMRRKELEEEQAILNRQAVTGLVPGGRR